MVNEDNDVILCVHIERSSEFSGCMINTAGSYNDVMMM